MAGLHGRPSRRAVAAGAAFVLLLGSGVALLSEGERTAKPPEVQPKTTIAEQVQGKTGEVAAGLAPLGLPELVAAASRAAAAFARGETTVPDNLGLADKRFDISLSFGCHGADGNADLPLSWSYDEEQQALTLRATPQDWPVERFAPDPSSTGRVEAIEGFWIPRPWLPTGECPARIAPPAPPPVVEAPAKETSAQGGSAPEAETTDTHSAASPSAVEEPRRTVGLAQFFPPGLSRWKQRAGEAYEIVRRLPPEELRRTGGYEFVLRGRVAPLPNGQIARCHSNSADIAPVCLISVEINSIAFRNPADGKLYAEWQS